jgi:hypothetical protein
VTTGLLGSRAAVNGWVESVRSPARCPLTIASKYPPRMLKVKASNLYIFSQRSASERERFELEMLSEGVFCFGFLLWVTNSDRGREQADLVLILLLMWASHFPPPSLPLLLSPSLPPFLLYLPTILL